MFHKSLYRERFSTLNIPLLVFHVCVRFYLTALSHSTNYACFDNSQQTLLLGNNNIFEYVFYYFCLNKFPEMNVLGQKELTCILRFFYDTFSFPCGSYQIAVPMAVCEITALENLTNTAHPLFLWYLVGGILYWHLFLFLWIFFTYCWGEISFCYLSCSNILPAPLSSFLWECFLAINSIKLFVLWLANLFSVYSLPFNFLYSTLTHTQFPLLFLFSQISHFYFWFNGNFHSWLLNVMLTICFTFLSLKEVFRYT